MIASPFQNGRVFIFLFPLINFLCSFKSPCYQALADIYHSISSLMAFLLAIQCQTDLNMMTAVLILAAAFCFTLFFKSIDFFEKI